MTTTKRIAVLTGQPMLCERLLAALDESQCELDACEKSDDLYQLSTHHRIDAIILLQRLPGFLSGLDIIERLGKDLVQPITVLVGDLLPDELKRASKLKIGMVLPTSAPVEAIAEAAINLLLTAIHTSIRIPYEARAMVRDADFIRPLPQLIVRLAAFLEDPNASIHALASEMATDFRVTADLLRMINSTAMGVSTKVGRLEDVIKLLGVKRTVSLVISSYLLASGCKDGLALPEELDRSLRLRSVIQAATAKTYATLHRHRAPEVAYVLGLLQDLGIVVLAHQMGGSYQRLLHRCQSVAQLNLCTYEAKELGYTHADVSAALLQKWELPPSLIRLVWQHHSDLISESVSEGDRQLLLAMQMGDALADLKENPAPQRCISFRRLALGTAGCTEASLRACMEQSVALACELSELFTVPIPDHQDFQQLVTTMASNVGLEFPAADAPAVAATGRPPPPRPMVVVIDDDQAILDVVTELLQGCGCDVKAGTSFDQVRGHVAAARLILLDIHLGLVSGMEVLKGLRRAGVDTPVVILTGDRTRTVIQEAIAAGTVDFLLKPFEPEHLQALVARYACIPATC